MRRQVNIDISLVRSLETFHDVIAKALEFPSYYGRNPDAFWDCLTDISEELRINIRGYRCLPGNIRREVEQYLDMFREYTDKSSGAFEVTFENEYQQ
jgi:ribonuclease inhibitor